MKKFKLPFPAPWTAFTTTDNKSWSFARVIGAVIVGFTMFWVTYLVVLTKKIPDNLGGLATLILTTYGINRGAEAYEARKPDLPAPPPQPQTQTVNVNP